MEGSMAAPVGPSHVVGLRYYSSVGQFSSVGVYRLLAPQRWHSGSQRSGLITSLPPVPLRYSPMVASHGPTGLLLGLGPGFKAMLLAVN